MDEGNLSPMQASQSPHPVDIHVGERVRLRRKYLGVSQETLAGAIDLTFQQVQKYERGANRMSASKLFEIAAVLKVSVGWFFEGLPLEGSEIVASQAESNVSAFLRTPEGVELAQVFSSIRRPAVRRRLLELLRTLSDE